MKKYVGIFGATGSHVWRSIFFGWWGSKELHHFFPPEMALVFLTPEKKRAVKERCSQECENKNKFFYIFSSFPPSTPFMLSAFMPISLLRNLFSARLPSLKASVA